jgi:hypothetical protein
MCPLDATTGRVAHRGLAVDRPERAHEVVARHTGDRGELVDIDRLGEVTVDVIACSAQVRDQLERNGS